MQSNWSSLSIVKTNVNNYILHNNEKIYNLIETVNSLAILTWNILKSWQFTRILLNETSGWVVSIVSFSTHIECLPFTNIWAMPLEYFTENLFALTFRHLVEECLRVCIICVYDVVWVRAYADLKAWCFLTLLVSALQKDKTLLYL